MISDRALLLTAQSRAPAGTTVHLDDRANASFVNECLAIAERNYWRDARLRLAWIYGGGLDTSFIRAGDRHLILHGELDLRVRSLQYDALTRIWSGDLKDDLLLGVNARLSAELCRYRRPEVVGRLLCLLEDTHFVHLATPYELETWPLDERYAALWSLAILHEAGHWFASYGVGRDEESGGFLRLRFDQYLATVTERWERDPGTRLWLSEFDPGAAGEADVIDEGFADQLMSDVFFEVFVNHVGGVTWGLREELSTINFEVAWLSVEAVVDELARWFMSVEWRLQLEYQLGIGRPEPIGHHMVLLELRREALATDFAQYLADPARLGAVGLTYSAARQQIERRMKERTETARASVGPAVDWLGHEATVSEARRLPATETVDHYFFEVAKPIDGPLVDLIATTGAEPQHYRTP